MQEVNINTLVDRHMRLNKNIPNNIIIVGKIDYIDIIHKYDQLDLSKVECNKIYYHDQDKNSIKNHILPNSLIKLSCTYNGLTSLPKLPNSLEILNCSHNNLTSFADTQLPNSLIKLICWNNKLTSFDETRLPNSLKELSCINNKVISLPDFSHIDHKIKLTFIQNLPIKYLHYNPNLKLNKIYNNKINIEGYPHNPITNQEELDKYMDYQFHKINRVKSARK